MINVLMYIGQNYTGQKERKRKEQKKEGLSYACHGW
jgi:hypothetical protein